MIVARIALSEPWLFRIQSKLARIMKPRSRSDILASGGVMNLIEAKKMRLVASREGTEEEESLRIQEGWFLASEKPFSRIIGIKY